MGQINPKVPIQDRFYKYKTKNKLITNAQITTNCCYSLWWVTKNKRDYVESINKISREMGV